uniref:Uncharacterized protein n=1 Tax=Panagrolaimus superbus TaxID=310955 RepID=A0A914XXH9_9BILA
MHIIYLLNIAYLTIFFVGEDIANHNYRDLVYFLLSCPVESGNGFKRLIQNLGKHELVVACRMVAAISGFPASSYGGVIARSRKDVPQINPDSMNKLGTMMRTLCEGDEETQMSLNNDLDDSHMEE